MIRALVERLRRRSAFRRALSLRRAWQRLVDGERPDEVARLVDEGALRSVRVEPRLAALAGIPCCVRDELARCTTQYLLSIALYSELQPGVMLALAGGRPTIAAPAAWRRVYERRSAPSAPLRSRLAFAWLVGLHFGRGLVTAWRIVRLHGADAPDPSPTHVFLEASPALLPRLGEGPADNLLLWYENALARPDGARLVVESRATSTVVETVPSALPPLRSIPARLAFIARVARLAVIALAALLSGRWWLALILRDLVLLTHARGLPREALPRAFGLHNGAYIHRPLYTAYVEHETGAPTRLLFYSTNIESLRRDTDDGPEVVLPGYRTMSFSRYLVWDEGQARTLAGFGMPADRIEVVGVLPFRDGEAQVPPMPTGTLAVFDVAPHKPSRLAAIGLVTTFYRGPVMAAFLQDLYDAAIARGLTLAIKQKRDIGRRADPRYGTVLKRLADAPGVVILDPGIAASRLIEESDIVVSAPFSSPSLIAAARGRPAAFYDPTGAIRACDRQRHGLPLLSTRAELSAWFDDGLAARISASRSAITR